MKTNLSITAFLGFLAVLLGAFAAHSLKEKLAIDDLKNFETGVRYQMYHVIVLLFVNGTTSLSAKAKKIISLFFFLGILFFSGSLYVISNGIVMAKSIWFITPLGGLFFIIAWLLLVLKFIKRANN